MIGTRLGPYEITAKIGEVGMGEVYRAADTRLDRQVAIKVLPAAFTSDPERLARFEGSVRRAGNRVRIVAQPIFTSLREHPRFQALLRRLNLS